MNNFKKLIFTFSFIITLFLLASCGNDKVESFMVKYRDDIQKEIYEEEEIDLDWFELVVTYTNGKVKTFRDHEYYLIKHNYSANGLFDHKNDDLDEIVFDLVFEYDKYRSNEVPILVKKDKVQEVSIVEIGKTEYLYGEMIDVSDFKLFIKYFNKPNEIIALTTEMLDLESGIIAPTELGVFEVEIWFNGVMANTPLSLIVSKNKQTLNKKDVKALYLGDKTIRMSEIEGAHYKFYPKGNNSEDYQWVLNNVFESNEPILTDYIVEVKYPETAYLEESNIVITELDYLSIQLQPHLVTKSETSVSFKAIAGYDVIMVDHRNLDITNPLNVVKEGEFITFNKLLPNHEYRFALRVTGKDVVYESQVLKEAVRTKPANSPIIFKENQTQAFTSESLNYLYTVKPTYKVEGVIFEVHYLQNGVRVEPLNVGVYQVELTTNLNDLVVKGTLTIVPKIVYANILNETKIYGDDDPLFDYEIKEIDKDFLSASFTRTEGEEVGNYQINGEIASSNPNYKVIVRPATLNIKKRTINLAINDSEGFYGSPDSEFTYELTNDSGDNITNEYSSKLEIHLSRNSGLNVGDYQIKLSSYNGSNINLTVSNYGTYKIKPHRLRVYAKSLTAHYGDSISKTEYLVNLNDLQYSDTKEVISGELSFKDFNGDVNTYVIEKGTLKVNSNYELIYEGNYLTVNPKEITLEYDGVFRYEYGHNDLANITASANVPLLAGEVINLSNLDAKAAGTYITEAFIKDQDNRDITFNYSITNKTTSFVITKKELVVTVNNTSRLYGTDNNKVVFTASVTGFVPGEENVNDLGFENNLKLTYETTATIESTKGSYLVWIDEGYVSSNYSFKYVPGILEVLARPFDIYADNLVVTYNNENVSYGLLENNVYIKDFNTNELIEGLTLNVSYKQNNIDVTPKEVGEYVVVISFAGNDEYEETQKEVALTINKKDVTVTYTNSVGLVYNGTDQEVLVSFAGLVDSFEPLVLNNVNRDAGNYTITVNGGNNYNITNPTHDYTIAKKTLTVTQLGSYTYNGYSQTISLDLTGKETDNLVIGDINLKDARSNEAYTLVYSGSDQANYILPETVLITIAKANLTITPNANQSKVYDGLAESNLTYTTNILGTDTISLVLEVTSKAAGIHPIVIKDGSLNYNSTNYNNPSLDIETFEISKKDITSLTQKGVATYNMQTQNIYFDLVGLISGDDFEIYVSEKNADSYNSSKFTKNGADIDNYNIIPASVNFTINKAIATLTGNEAPVNGYAVYGEDYTNNAITVFNDLNKFKLTLNGVEIDEAYTLNYSESELDLSNGGTTFVVDVSITFNSGNFEQIPNTKVVYKFKSVTIGTNYTQLYTIEDAIKKDGNEEIFIKYYTAFSSIDILNNVYNFSNQISINKNITIPYDINSNGSYKSGLNQVDGLKLVRTNAFSKLFISENLKLYVSSQIIVSAQTGYAQPNGGVVDGSYYGELIISDGVEIILQFGSKFHSYGYTYGKGEIISNNGSEIKESSTITGHRGGTVVSGIVSFIFPYDMYNFNNIESKITFNYGSKYLGATHVYASGTKGATELPIIGQKSMFNITENTGYITKEYENGIIRISIVDTKVTMENITINPGVEFISEGKYISIPGVINIILVNSTIQLNASIKLMPGSLLSVDQDSEVIINKNAFLHIYSENEYINSNSPNYAYFPSNWLKTFREQPNLEFSYLDEGRLELNGKLLVKGGISGVIESPLGIGQIQLNEGFKKYSQVEFFQNLDSVHYKTYTLKDTNNLSILNSGTYIINQDGLYTKNIEFNFGNENEVIEQIYGEKWLIPNGTASIWYTETGLLYDTDEIFKGASSGELFDYFNISESKSITMIYNISEIDTETIIVDKGSSINNYSLPISEIEGYTFLGWYTDSLFNNLLTNTIVENDISIYGRYIPGKIEITFTPSSTEINNDGKINLIINIKDGDGNTLKNIPIQVSAANMDGKVKVYNSDANGQVKANDLKFKYAPLLGSSLYSHYYITELLTNKVTQVMGTVKITKSSPIIYSEDKEGNLYFEHEPISFSMLKSVEGTTFGTLRLIQDQDGVYYIQIIEEGDSITALNSAKLYAIDYLSNQGVIDAMFDVYGNPHTIKERISPIEFMDQNGVSYLSQVLHNDDNYAAIGETEDLLSYFIATFDNSNLSNQAKLMITPREVGNTLGVLMPILATINGVDNLWWIDQAFMNDPLAHASIQNVFNSLLKMKIQVWDGYDWVTQGEIDPKTYLNEEMMVYLDLSNIHETELKVRLLFAGGLNYHIDSIYIDFSEDVDMIYHELNLSSAILNGSTDILDKMLNNADYIYLSYKEGVRLGFDSPELLEGYERTIGVSMKGYIYAAGAHVDDELLDESIGLSFEELKDLILSSERPELVEFVDAVEELYYTLVYVGTLDYEEIIYYMFEILAEIEEIFYEGLE